MPLTIPRHFGLLLEDKKVFCGFSGGADSLTLLLLLAEYQKKYNFVLEAVHFEHGFRGFQSLQDAEFCKSTCDALNIPLQIISLNVPAQKQKGEGDEEAARRLRLEYWKTLPADSVAALGHHADDLAENLFLRFMRGANVSGLTSLSHYSVVQGVAIFRPLLEYSRVEIEEYLIQHKMIWRTDSTNLESDYGRNFLRNTILPAIYKKFPYSRGGILRAYQNLSADAEYIDAQAKQIYKTFDPSDRSSWAELPQALLCRILRLHLSFVCGTDDFSGHHLVERFKKMIQNPPGRGFTELEFPDHPEITLYVGKKQIFFKKNVPVESVKWNRKQQDVIHWGGYTFVSNVCSVMKFDDPYAVYFDSEMLPEELILKSGKTSDLFFPFGKSASVPLKKIFSDAKVPGPLRDMIPVLCSADGTLLWIPGVRRSSFFPVSSGNILQISCYKN